MTHSAKCRDLVASFEGCRLYAYPDGGGVWTIGHGHTAGVHDGDICTEEQALAMLDLDLKDAEKSVNAVITAVPTQNQFDAMVSLAFNIGGGAFSRSTVCRAFNAGRLEEAAAGFLMWVNIGKKASAGLLNRRMAEKALFLS